MTRPIRVLLADDHAMLRQGTAELLLREPDIEVIAEAGDGRQAIELARQLKPDIVVMDVRMPDTSGIEATIAIREQFPDIQVLVLSAHDDDQYIFSLLQAGASGYLLKTAPASELIRAIRLVYAGESPLDPSIARKVIIHMAQGGSGEAYQDPKGAESLTPRELEVLQLLAQGKSNVEIATELYISDRTVQSHLTNIFAKLQVSSRLEAVLLGIRQGWLALDG